MSRLIRSDRRRLERSAKRAFSIMGRLDGITRGIDPDIKADDAPRLVEALESFVEAMRAGECGEVRRLYRAMGGPRTLTDADVLNAMVN